MPVDPQPAPSSSLLEPSATLPPPAVAPPVTDESEMERDVSFAAVPRTHQPDLFGDSPAEYPQDIQDAMKTMLGGMELDNRATVPHGSEETARAFEGGPNAQTRWASHMLKAHEAKNAKVAFFDFRIRVLDLAIKDEAAELALILDEAGALGSDLQFDLSPAHTVIDEKSERGFRSITTIRTWRTKLGLPPQRP